MDEGNIIEDAGEDKAAEIVEVKSHELCILKTDADKKGTDIAEMSNFFDTYLQQLTYELKLDSEFDIISSIPVADLGILNDVVNQVEAAINTDFGLLPDFDNLPRDVRTKLKKGIYTIGKSKQVDGNARAVILDEEGVRVKDITLKKVMKIDGSLETTRNIVNQLQMRQLYAKLSEIQELQTYQIDRDRDRDVLVPFLNARDYILEAQTTNDIETRKDKLIKASDEIKKAINAIYTDMETTSKYLAKSTRRPIFQNTTQIKNYMNYLISDLQLATKYVGVQMHVFDYLGEKGNSRNVLEKYQYNMDRFLNKGLNRKEESAANLLHNYYPYDDKNNNCWYQLSKDMELAIQSGTRALEEKEIYLISVEDVVDERKE